MISFRIKGTAVRIGFSFLVFNALIFLLRESSQVCAFYAACIFHECGHLTALWLTGSSPSYIVFGCTGIRIGVRGNGAVSVLRSLIVLLAGPAANVTVYFITKLTDCGGELALLNLTAAAYNMLPYRSLDGGAAIALFTEGRPFESAAEILLTVLRLLIAAAAALAVWKYGMTALPLLIAAAAPLILRDV